MWLKSIVRFAHTNRWSGLCWRLFRHFLSWLSALTHLQQGLLWLQVGAKAFCGHVPEVSGGGSEVREEGVLAGLSVLGYPAFPGEAAGPGTGLPLGAET